MSFPHFVIYLHYDYKLGKYCLFSLSLSLSLSLSVSLRFSIFFVEIDGTGIYYHKEFISSLSLDKAFNVIWKVF